MRQSLILHPDISRRRDRIAMLVEELTACFDERLHLVFEVMPALRHRYSETFGELERNVQERTLDLSERKRMVELFSVKLDRGQKLDATMVELVLRAVHNEFGRIRSRMARAVNIDMERDGERSSRRRRDRRDNDAPRPNAAEVRDLYRRLARRLHPDGRGKQNDLSQRYWEMTQQAKKRHDLSLLRTLLHLVETVHEIDGMSSSALEAEEARLIEALRRERTFLESLRNEELYRLRDRLDNEAWLASRRRELEAELADIETEIAKCDRFLAPILSLRKSTEPQVVQNIWEGFVESMYLNNR